MSLKIQKRQLKLYTPHPIQRRLHVSLARYRVAAWGRQAGKSTWGLNELLRCAWTNQNHTYWFVSPTYSQANIQYRRLIQMLWNCSDVIIKANQTDLRVEFMSGSQIRFVSGEVLENLRGETLHGVVIDEVRQQHPDLWKMVIRPMLTTTQGWAAFISTPNGFDSFYDLFEQARSDQSGQWEAFQAPSTCNPLFTQKEFDQLKSEMSEAVFAQEILAEFRDVSQGKAYLNHGSHNLKQHNPFSDNGLLYSPHLPIIVGLDFNVGLMCWELGQEKNNDWFFADEVSMRNTNTQEAAKVLAQKVKGHKAGVILLGDASGKARKTSAAGETDYTLLTYAINQVSVRCENRTPEANPPVRDRVNVVNAALKDAANRVHLFYNPENCTELKKDFDRVVWRQGAGNAVLDQMTDKERTHSSDAVGYPVYHFKMHSGGQVGTIRIIR